MRNLSRRIERVEERLGTGDDEMPSAVTLHVRERSFANREGLMTWHAQHERRAREQARACESESFAEIGMVVVSICRAGEQPTEREIGVETLGGYGIGTLGSSDVPS